jgi:hypothetical protein
MYFAHAFRGSEILQSDGISTRLRFAGIVLGAPLFRLLFTVVRAIAAIVYSRFYSL